MIKKTLTVLLIEDNPEYAELVQRWLSLREDATFVLSWTDSLMEGMNSLTLGGVDVILLDLGLPDSDGISTFTTIKTFAPGVPIIILSASDSESLALRLVQEGAQDYLLKSVCTSDSLAKAIQYALVRYVGPVSSDGAPRLADPTKVIGVVGAKGGVGTTTFACNLALELRRQTGEKTLLVDLDVQGGLVGFLMNLTSDCSIADAVVNYQRLDASVWKGITICNADELDIVRSPGLLGASEINADKLRHVMTLIRPFHRQIVVDLGRLNRVSSILLDRINEVFLVTTTSVAALYEAKRAIGALRKADFDGDRLRLIVNQHDKTQAYAGNDLDRVFGIPIFAKLPDCGRELNEAIVRGKMPAENSDYREHIAVVARKIAGLPEKNARGPVSQLFSFVDKLR